MKNKDMRYGGFHNSPWRKLHHGQRLRGNTLKGNEKEDLRGAAKGPYYIPGSFPSVTVVTSTTSSSNCWLNMAIT